MLKRLTQDIMGAVLLWVFIVVVGFVLYFFDEYPLMWLVGIFILTPAAILIRNHLQSKKKRKEGA